MFVLCTDGRELLKCVEIPLKQLFLNTDVEYSQSVRETKTLNRWNILFQRTFENLNIQSLKIFEHNFIVNG